MGEVMNTEQVYSSNLITRYQFLKTICVSNFYLVVTKMQFLTVFVYIYIICFIIFCILSYTFIVLLIYNNYRGINSYIRLLIIARESTNTQNKSRESTQQQRQVLFK